MRRVMDPNTILRIHLAPVHIIVIMTLVAVKWRDSLEKDRPSLPYAKAKASDKILQKQNTRLFAFYFHFCFLFLRP